MTAAKQSTGPRRGLSEAQAAAYVGIGQTKFRELVESNKMPRPRLIGTRRLFDIVLLDAAIDDLPMEGGETVDTWADFRDGSNQTEKRRAV